MGPLGMKQVDLVVNGEKLARCYPSTGRPRRGASGSSRIARELSRAIGAASWVVLVIALVLEVPQLAALIGDGLGADLEPPLMPSGPANFIIGIAALAAAVERALRFKSNRWLG